MLEQKIKNFSEKISSKIQLNYNLKKLNWFNIGGKAKIFFKAENLNDLSLFLKEFRSEKNIFIIGAGSNILLSDKLYDGAVIKLGKNFSNMSLMPNDIIVAGAAVTDKKLSDFALKNEIGGFEFLSCIPGTIGGGLKINSGCYGREFKDILVSVQIIDREGIIRTIPSSKIKLSYRKSNLEKNYIYLSASFKGYSKDKIEIKKEVEFLKKKKEFSQPSRIKTGGSTFKNPLDQSNRKVWQLIKESVPLEKSFGDACISKKHCNFFINDGGSSADDIEKLINYVKKKVLDKHNINLDLEIKIIGEKEKNEK